MADLGNIIGTLMSELIKARRMSDEQTAVLAEYYKTNPLLEGLSVPRIRIPELTIDMPVILEDLSDGEVGEFNGTDKIVSNTGKQLDEILAKNNIVVNPQFREIVLSEFKAKLEVMKSSRNLVLKESVSRSIQDALAVALKSTRTEITRNEKELLTKELSTLASEISISKENVPPGVITNIKTSDIKDKTSDANVVRVHVTFREEGLEWANQKSETGGIVRSLQPE